jgi:hypothetical protein
LGIFPGKIRFSEHCDVAQAIEGRIPNLWLDYSQVTGTLNQMQVAQAGVAANVYLDWEGVNENVETGPCESWRVLVLAIRKIMPFEPLIRAAPSEKQFALHQSINYARTTRDCPTKHAISQRCNIANFPTTSTTDCFTSIAPLSQT